MGTQGAPRSFSLPAPLLRLGVILSGANLRFAAVLSLSVATLRMTSATPRREFA